MSSNDRLKNEFDITSYLQEHDIAYAEEGDNIGSGWIGLETCPFCGDENYHCGVCLADKHYSCWVCGARGDAISLVCAVERIGYHKALVRLGQYQSSILRDPVKRIRPKTRISSVLPNGYRQIVVGKEPLVVKEYFTRRGFPSTIYKQYGLGWVPVGEYQMRVIVPVYLDKALVSFLAMDVTGQAEQKYLDCPKDRARVFNKELLYGIDGTGDQIIVVEGVTDKWRIDQWGSNAFGVALFTKNFTDAQVRCLARRARGRKVKVITDRDAPTAGLRFRDELLLEGINAKAVVLEPWDAKDPGDMDKDSIHELLCL